MKIASYKGTRKGIQGIFNIGVRWWLAGSYSHTELVFSDGMCGSCSLIDHGVRLKHIDFSTDKWDFEEVEGDEEYARKWFEDHTGEKYSILLLSSFVLKFLLRFHKSGHVCSTAVGHALKRRNANRLDPCIISHESK